MSALSQRSAKRTPKRTPKRRSVRGARRRSATRGLVGRDVSRLRLASNGGLWAVGITAAIVFALGLAVLRVDVIRLRYALAGADSHERKLREQSRDLVVEMRSLRDPVKLAEIARERGFGVPDRVLDLRTVDVAAAPSPLAATEDVAASARAAR
jgi:hypothetical protein